MIIEELNNELNGDLIVSLRELEACFKQEHAFIKQHRSDIEVGEFPSLDGLKTKGRSDLEILKVRCGVSVSIIRRVADNVQSQLDEAESLRAEQDMTEMDRIKRALYDLAARVSTLEGGTKGRQLPTSDGVRTEVAQFLGMPAGMGRPAVAGATRHRGDVWKVGSNT